ncbi:MFS transporter [Fictibacillus nanhaiensis]|uniref:MFS transporter n=1 Tax=Fictibacillus nanhaiensis TaxID=742169 RepID=UPI001C93BDDF|nr:MFS transporter [Fictibacillus nanhaiensis]MBY6038243.1 MFS transporter [Fictibacillus nanhaiensis]
MPTHSVLKDNRPLFFLMIVVFITHLGSYLVLPVLPILLKVETGLSAAQIGFTLAIISIFMQSGSVVGGILADRTGRRFIISLGAFIRAAGLLGFAYFSSYPFVLLTAAVSGLGLGLNAPSTKAFISSLVKEDMRSTAFSLRGIFANMGMALAGLTVFALFTGHSRLIFITAAVIYLSASAISWFFLPAGCGDEHCGQVKWKDYKQALRNIPFLVFIAATIFVWALYVQFALVLPLRAENVLANGKDISIIWTINSVTVILVQTVVTKNIIRHIHPLTSVGLGSICIGLSLGSLFFANTLFFFVFAGLVFIIGEMLLMPTLDTAISQLAVARFLGMFFGLASVFTGIGEAAGNFIGGRLFELSAGGERITPYVVYVIAGFSIFLGMQLLRRWNPLSVIEPPKHKHLASSPGTESATSHPNPIKEG